MDENKIIIPARTLSYLKPGSSGLVKLLPEVYNLLVDLANESGLSMNRIASSIIQQAIEKDLIKLEKSFNTEGD